MATGVARGVRLPGRPVPNAARYQVLRCSAHLRPGRPPVALVDVPTARFAQAATPGTRRTYAVRAVAASLRLRRPAARVGTALIPQVWW